MPIPDPLSFVKSHEMMFPIRSRVPGLGLARRVIVDALVYGNGTCEVFREGGWWFVVSDADWLASVTKLDEADTFSEIIAVPEVEDNSLRSEILLNAFADSIWVLTPTTYKMIKGDSEQQKTLEQIVERRRMLQDWQRIYAFASKI
jgi:hypothetical protein